MDPGRKLGFQCIQNNCSLEERYLDLTFPVSSDLSSADNLCKQFGSRSGSEVLQLLSCLIQLSMKFQLFIKTKIPINEKFLALSLSYVVFIMLINV